MFARKRNEIRKSRGQLLREELGETFDHALRAAGHAASGVDAAMRPRVAAAREYASPAVSRVRARAARGLDSTRVRLAPLSEAAQARATEIRKAKPARKGADGSRRRWPVLAGLLAGGAAAGALGALVLRRRRRQPGPEEVPEELAGAGEPATGGTAGPNGAAPDTPAPDGSAPEAATPDAPVPYGGTGPQPVHLP